MAKKYKSYIQLSGNGNLFIDLSDEKVIKSLSPQQQEYVKTYERMYNARLDLETPDYFGSVPDFVQTSILLKQRAILTGAAYRYAQKVFFENYEKSLRINGYNELAKLLKATAGKLRKQKSRQAFISDLPNMDLYYPRGEEGSRGSEAMMKDIAGQVLENIMGLIKENNLKVDLRKYFKDKDVLYDLVKDYGSSSLLTDINEWIFKNPYK